MASPQGSSSTAAGSSIAASEESRPEAGPLPKKRGEIGYKQEFEEVQKEEGSERGTSPLPDRHPADRSVSPPASSGSSTQAAASTGSTTTADDSSSTVSLKKEQPFLKRKYGGIQLGTLLVFIAQILTIFGTIAGWVVAGILLSRSSKSSNSNDSDSSTASMSGSSAIFVHVVFAVGFLSQCLFLERRIYVMRAQRYGHLHPGEILPTSRRGRVPGASVAFSPWNRPPLPTYAAALAQSGVGTGDVEDHIIAAPPPPAYGNTRGSRLLLSGFLDANLRAQRPVSVRTEMSQQQHSRPASYATTDEDWEVIQNADRARRLEETLANLEVPGSRRQSRS